MSTKNTQISIIYCIHDDTDYLRSSLDSVAFLSCDDVPEPRDLQDVFVFVSRVPWHATPGDWQSAEALGATVVLGDWPNEQTQRHAAIV